MINQCKAHFFFGTAAPLTPLNPAPILNLDFLFVFKNEIRPEGLVGENTFNGIPENPEYSFISIIGKVKF